LAPLTEGLSTEFILGGTLIICYCCIRRVNAVVPAVLPQCVGYMLLVLVLLNSEAAAQLYVLACYKDTTEDHYKLQLSPTEETGDVDPIVSYILLLMAVGMFFVGNNIVCT